MTQDREHVLAFLNALDQIERYARQHLDGLERLSDILRLARSQKAIAPKGVIGESLEYAVHGAGCRFVLDGLEVDLDFTADGSYAFDVWRLNAFVEALPGRELEESHDLETACRQLAAEELIHEIRPGWFMPAQHG